MKIEIKNKFTGKVIFKHENKNNTIKDTLMEAIKKGVDLRGADLSSAKLYCANLRGTNLYDAGKIEDWMSFDNVGSRKARTLFFKTDKGVFVQCGCFFGNLKEFVAKVKETHNGNKYENDYLALVEFIKVRFNKNETKEYFSKNTGYNLFKKFIYQIKKNIFLRKV